jgi:hypothetical protein
LWAGLRTHSEVIVRINAERAIWRITGGLTEIGPAAAAAIPLLRVAIEEPARQPQWASSDMLIIEDETWIDACTRALSAITPQPS